MHLLIKIAKNGVVCAITFDRFHLDSLHLAQISTVGRFCLGKSVGQMNRDTQGHLVHLLRNAPPNGVGRAINLDMFQLESPNVSQICILGSFPSGLYMGVNEP